MTIKSYRDLVVWQRSFRLARSVYQILAEVPRAEQFELISQVQRSAIPIPSNIAEGQQRSGPKEFKQFLSIARGSAAELSTQLQLVQEIYDINTLDHVNEVEEIQKMLYVLQSKL